MEGQEAVTGARSRPTRRGVGDEQGIDGGPKQGHHLDGEKAAWGHTHNIQHGPLFGPRGIGLAEAGDHGLPSNNNAPTIGQVSMALQTMMGVWLFYDGRTCMAPQRGTYGKMYTANFAEVPGRSIWSSYRSLESTNSEG